MAMACFRNLSVVGSPLTRTRYPLLRRLEKQGFLTSEWNTDETRPRKFYRTSPAGVRLAEMLTREWLALSDAIASLTDDSPTTPTDEER